MTQCFCLIGRPGLLGFCRSWTVSSMGKRSSLTKSFPLPMSQWHHISCSSLSSSLALTSLVFPMFARYLSHVAKAHSALPANFDFEVLSHYAVGETNISLAQYMDRCVQRDAYKKSFPGAPNAAKYVASQVAKIGKGPGKKTFGFL